MINIAKIAASFRLEGTVTAFEPFGEGHINDTYRVPTDAGKCYILQRMNHYVFADIDGLMENVVGVTEHIRKKVKATGGDPARKTLTIVPTLDGKSYLTVDGTYWRCTIFIADTITLQTVERPEDFCSAGRAFGDFQRLLSDYPAQRLHETIKDFHNTPVRYENFCRAVEADAAGLRATAEKEIAWVKDHRYLCGELTGRLAAGKLPLRVTHNDTKINNCMLDAKTGQPLVVVDLDTVMPGLAAYDFGDSIRFGATHAAEDEKDLSKVHFDLYLYTAFAEGFLAGCGSAMDKEELLSLPAGAVLMTYECGMRFLTDYLEGSHYFKTTYAEHNLVRCRTQFQLVDEMLDQYKTMQNIVLGIAANL